MSPCVCERENVSFRAVQKGDVVQHDLVPEGGGEAVAVAAAVDRPPHHQHLWPLLNERRLRAMASSSFSCIRIAVVIRADSVPSLSSYS